MCFKDRTISDYFSSRGGRLCEHALAATERRLFLDITYATTCRNVGYKTPAYCCEDDRINGKLLNACVDLELNYLFIDERCAI